MLLFIIIVNHLIIFIVFPK